MSQWRPVFRPKSTVFSGAAIRAKSCQGTGDVHVTKDPAKRTLTIDAEWKR
jgi:hypothetical protein